MITSSDEAFVISSFGWVEKGGVWWYSVQSREATTIPLSRARWVELFAGENDLFSALHHWEGEKVELTVARISAPGDVLARAVISPDGQEISGDDSLLSRVPAAYTGWYESFAGPAASNAAYHLFQLDTERREMRVTRLTWFNEDYDWGYQGVTGVVQVPNSPLLLFTVQRDHNLVLYDPEADGVVRKIPLAGRNGADDPQFRDADLWVKDYDHLLRVDPRNWSTVASVRLQGDIDSPYGPSASFIGEFGFDQDGASCYVARPESRDVLLLDADSMKVTRRAELEGQPLEASLLADGTVIARDWKSGRLLSGKMSKAGWRFRLP